MALQLFPHRLERNVNASHWRYLRFGHHPPAESVFTGLLSEGLAMTRLSVLPKINVDEAPVHYYRLTQSAEHVDRMLNTYVI